MPTRENGTSPPPQARPVANLAERLTNHIPQVLTTAAAKFVDSLKLSSVSEGVRRGRRVVIKHRNAYSEQLADLANLYFRVSNIPIRFWSKVSDWKRWEIDCFRMLNGDRFRAISSGAKTICVDKLPGKSLWAHLNRGTLTRQMLEAAAHELRRAHQFWSDEFRGPWSHGDAGMENVVFNGKTGRARLIDFEIIHDRSVPAATRHADDLLVFLLDIAAVVPGDKWLPFALRFLDAYGNLDVIAELKHQLALPNGMAWIWWGVRTSFANPAKVKLRLAKLRDLTAHLRHYRAVAARRARKRRRASISCHEMSPGMPSASSRTRAIRESAKAASPGIPSRLPTTT
jgi:hypothetical protein